MTRRTVGAGKHIDDIPRRCITKVRLTYHGNLRAFEQSVGDRTAVTRLHRARLICNLLTLASPRRPSTGQRRTFYKLACIILRYTFRLYNINFIFFIEKNTPNIYFYEYNKKKKQILLVRLLVKKYLRYYI